MSTGLPEDLYERVFEKTFSEQVYDAGEAFVFDEQQSGAGIKLTLVEHCQFFTDHSK